MKVERTFIHAEYVKSLIWSGETLVDWAAGGTTYYPDGRTRHSGLSMAFEFDGAVSSRDGVYIFIYKRLGTKGLLLKSGEILREVNRSFYFADTYDYPCCFITSPVGVTYLVHCPNDYKKLDFEEVETGRLLTQNGERTPLDFFHSRLLVGPDSAYFIDRGWFWHPCDKVQIFDVARCLENPAVLDEPFMPGGTTELSTADFIDRETLVIGASNEPPMDDLEEDGNLIRPAHIGIWNIPAKRLLHQVKPSVPFGNLIAIDDRYVWDVYRYPKIIDLTDGVVVYEAKDIDSGGKNSAIDQEHGRTMSIAYQPRLRRLAIHTGGKIEILSL